MTIGEVLDTFWKNTESFIFWNKTGDFFIEEDWGRPVYENKTDCFFLDSLTGDELHSLISQCEKEGNDKALVDRVKGFPVPDDELGIGA